jgi:hypothetical protein
MLSRPMSPGAQPLTGSQRRHVMTRANEDAEGFLGKENSPLAETLNAISHSL